MKRTLAHFLLLAAFASTAFAERGGSYGATNPPPAPGTPHFVQMDGVEGLPRDAAERGAVMAGLRGAFASLGFGVETRDPVMDTWRADGRAPNRFRLLEGDPSDSVWTLRVVFGFPHELPASRLKTKPTSSDAPATARALGTRAARGFTIVLSARSPEDRFRDVTPDARRVEVVLPADSTGAFAWTLAGNAAGALALETLHRGSGDLRETQRVALAPARRTTN